MFEKAKSFLINKGYGDRVHTFDVSSATVILAGKALNCDPKYIAKSLTFSVDDYSIMIVCAGDTKIDNSKYKAVFKCKARMLTYEEVEEKIGHAVGGVCPFGINENVKVYLDDSLKRFEYVYPACGSSNSAVKLTPAELEKCCDNCEWIDVCKIIECEQ